MITPMSIIHPFNKDCQYRMTEVPPKTISNVTLLPESSPKRCTRSSLGARQFLQLEDPAYLKLTGGFTQNSRCSVLARVSFCILVWVCLKMSCTPLYPMVLLIIIPINWL